MRLRQFNVLNAIRDTCIVMFTTSLQSMEAGVFDAGVDRHTTFAMMVLPRLSLLPG